MTQSLKDVLFKTQHLSKIEQLNALKQAWLKCRQIGASEAVYRLISGLHLTASNISTIFVATGFPEILSQCWPAALAYCLLTEILILAFTRVGLAGILYYSSIYFDFLVILRFIFLFYLVLV